MKEGPALTLYALMLSLGISLIMIGIILLILSLKPVQPKQGISGGGFFVEIVGFLPIIFGSRNTLRLGLIVIVMFSVLLGLMILYPSLIGW